MRKFHGLIVLFMAINQLLAFSDERSQYMRVSQGRNAQKIYPFLVSLWITDFKRLLHCGGTLVTPNVILTAAHCFYDSEKNPLKNIQIKSYFNTLKIAEGIFRTNHGVIIHPGFQYLPQALNNDLALVFFDDPVPFTPASLPGTPYSIAYPGDIVQIIGWGATDTVNQSIELMEAKMTLANRYKDPCNRNQAIQTKLCALIGDKPNNQSTARGDSGGPVLLRDTATGNYVIAGVVSALVTFRDSTRLNVFMDVGTYMPWILQNIQDIYNKYISS